ncbi:MAG: hypothetical protein ACO1OD_04715 [Croceibacterium sp.]
MMILELTAALLATQASSANAGLPTSSAERVAVMREYQACLRKEALALERSGADFDDVYEAADTACASVWARLFDLSTTEFEGRDDLQEDPADVAFRFTQNLKTAEKPEIRLAFLRMRTLRNTD